MPPQPPAAHEQGRTPLHRAACHAGPRVVSALTSKGADTQARDDDGETALFCATRRDRPDLVSALEERTALHIAAERGLVQAAAMLVEKKKGVNVSAKDRSGQTALQLAQTGGHRRVMSVIKENMGQLSKEN